ncbi:type II/IV secretion system protein [Bacillus sp. TS-2]|nr:type II/IV secretion system protein [Bacillus sp. TS-2]
MDALINQNLMESIKKELKEKHPTLFVSAFTNLEDREVLKQILKEEHSTLLGNDVDKLDYLIQELVGLGIIDNIVSRKEEVTDIYFNSTELIVETNMEKYIYDGEVSEDYAIKLIQKFAFAVGKEFTPKTPILDAAVSNLRINAVNQVNAPYGTTFATRVARPKLMLTEDNWDVFAPEYMLEFFKMAITTKSNIVISGETGTGKTELQKFLVGHMLFEDKIIMIEDVLESHIKTLFPHLDIISWLTAGGVTLTDLIKAALRNNPKWLLISETRGEEAYEMMQAVLAGKSIVTSLHSKSAKAIPRRFVHMAKTGYQFDEHSFLDDIYRYFDFGVHIKKKKVNGKTIRYLTEVVEFLEDGTANTVFERIDRMGKVTYKTYDLSDEFKNKVMELNLVYPGLPKVGEKVVI